MKVMQLLGQLSNSNKTSDNDLKTYRVTRVKSQSIIENCFRWGEIALFKQSLEY